MWRRKDDSSAGLPSLTPRQIEPPAMKSEPVKKQAPREVWQVVDKLPVQEIRTTNLEDGTVVNFITVEEYLTQQANGK